jgi:hypothetical protein
MDKSTETRRGMLLVDIVNKLNNVAMAMPTIDGHFWVERDGEKIDPYFPEYDVIKAVHKGVGWVYLPADKLTQRMMISIVESIIKKEFETVEEYLFFSNELLRERAFGFGQCHKNSFVEINNNGGTLVFGSYGILREDGSIFYEYGGVDYKGVKAFITK